MEVDRLAGQTLPPVGHAQGQSRCQHAIPGRVEAIGQAMDGREFMRLQKAVDQ